MVKTDNEDPPGSETALTRAQPEAVGGPLALPPDLADLTAEVLRRSRSEATWAIYRKAWKRFEGWCYARGFKPLEVSAEVAAAYLVDAAKKGASLSDIEQRRAAISAAYAAKNLPPPTWAPLVKMALKSIRKLLRAHHRPHKKTALTEDLLLKLVERLDRATPAGKRDAALLIVGQLGAFRRGALARLQVEDLTKDERGYSIRVAWDKTDQAGEEERLKILPPRDSPLDPVRALNEWMHEIGNPTSGPIFRQLRHGKPAKVGILGRTVAEVVKKACLAAGVEGDFSGHSLRSGLITTAIRKGITLDRIQAQTFHKDINVLLGYYQRVDPFSGNAATDLAAADKPKEPKP